MHFVKTTHVADFVSFAGTLLGAIPTPLQAVLAPMLSEMPISLCNTICTNVPGPKQALYLLGHRMLSAYPYVPIGGEMMTRSIADGLGVSFEEARTAFQSVSALAAFIGGRLSA